VKNALISIAIVLGVSGIVTGALGFSVQASFGAIIVIFVIRALISISRGNE